MDALSDVLRTVHLKGGVFLHAEFSEPWCLGVKVLPESCAPFLGETSEIIPYHYVVEGHLRIQVTDGSIHEVASGGLALFPRNDYHLLGGDLIIEWDEGSNRVFMTGPAEFVFEGEYNG